MKRFLFAGALALAVFPAFAQDASADFEALAGGEADAAPQADLGALTWSGDQEFAWRWGAAEDPTRTGGLVDGTLAAEYKLDDFKVVAAGSVRNNEFVPGETAVFFAPGTLRFGLGLQEFSWGVADGNNPTDTLNARDYRYGANAARLVNPAVTAAWYPADWLSLEAVYEPWKAMSKFPKDFRASTQASLSALGTTVSARDLKQDGSEPAYAARANFFLTGVDLSLSYAYDWDTYYTPVISSYQAGSQLPGAIDLQLNRVQRIGLNAKTTVDRFGLWFEGAYNLTEDPSSTEVGIRDSKLTWTTGVDFNFGPSGAYYLNLQYAGTWIPGFDAATLSDYAADPVTNHIGDQAYMKKRFYRALTQSLGAETEEWMHGGTLSLKFPLADALVTPSFTTALLLPVGYDKIDAAGKSRDRLVSAYFKPELDVAPADGVHLLIGADLAYGWIKQDGAEASLDTTTDKLGTYTSQNSVYVKVQYKWNGGM